MMAPQINEEVLLTSEKSDVYVIPDPDRPGRFLVVPGTLGVPEDGKKIWIRNISGSLAEVTFRIVIGSGGPVEIQNGKSRSFDLKKAPVGVYEYKVDVVTETGTRVPAEGGSNPRIVYG
jgi:hypothetical protein